MYSITTALTTSIAIFCVSLLDLGDERTSISSLMKSVMQDDFDITIANKMDADHGLTVPLTLMCGQPHAWPCPVIPIATNVVPFPVPSGQRGLKLDRARRKAAESFDSDLKVQIWGTGGMSHQLQGGRWPHSQRFPSHQCVHKKAVGGEFNLQQLGVLLPLAKTVSQAAASAKFWPASRFYGTLSSSSKVEMR